MHDSFGAGQGVGPAVRRFGTLALVGVVLLSAVGSSGIVAAQQDGSPRAGNNTTQGQTTDSASRPSAVPDQPVQTVLERINNSQVERDYRQIPTENQTRIRTLIRELATENLSTQQEEDRIQQLISNFHHTSGGVLSQQMFSGSDEDIVRDILRKELSVPGRAAPSNDTTQQVIGQFIEQEVGYEPLPSDRKQRINDSIQSLAHENLSTREENQQIHNIIQAFSGAGGAFDSQQFTSDDQENVETILQNVLGVEQGGSDQQIAPVPGLDLDIGNLMSGKLRSLANNFVEGAANILGNIYNLAFSTPVPQNDGWHGVFGSPTNAPFQQLHQNLLLSTLYPVTNYLLGIGVLVLGLSLVVNPLLSRFRALDLMVKFTTFLLFYTFSWAAITFMHGIVNDITLWIRPSPDAMGELVTNVGTMSVAAVGAYFAGAGGILTTVFGLGLELGLRNAALQYFFPYVFPALLLLLYLSPWQRLRGYANMAIWQYVNLLTMIIPMAILLRAATIVEFSPGDGVTAMLVVIALFLLAASFPFVSTYFFIQMTGSVAGGVKSATAGAASRVGAAKDKIDRSEESSSDSTDSTATATTSPGDRAQAMVGSVRASDTGQSQSQPQSRSVGQFGSSTDREHDAADSATTAEHDTADSATTAGKIRALHEQEHRDPMNPKAMKTAYFGQNPSRST